MSARELTMAERRRRGTELCRRLAQDVAEIAPPSVGAWSRTWDLVAQADADFMASLTGWEADPTPATLDRTSSAYRAVLDAWRQAARQFESEREGADR